MIVEGMTVNQKYDPNEIADVFDGLRQARPVAPGDDPMRGLPAWAQQHPMTARYGKIKNALKFSGRPVPDNTLVRVYAHTGNNRFLVIDLEIQTPQGKRHLFVRMCCTFNEMLNLSLAFADANNQSEIFA